MSIRKIISNEFENDPVAFTLGVCMALIAFDASLLLTGLAIAAFRGLVGA